jgi:DtxR family Mn-dependent transcriptional regulator/ferrous iron transport protein A
MKTPLFFADLKKGSEARVLRVLTSDKDVLKRYAAMGIFPGVKVKLLQKTPSFLFQVGRSQFAADRELVTKIEVEIV